MGRWVVDATPRTLYSRLTAPRTGLDGYGKSCLTGVRSQDRPARPQSLYRLSYPGLSPGLLLSGNGDPFRSWTLTSFSFIQVVCLTTGPKPLPKPALHIVRPRVSFFKWEYPLLSLRSSSSLLRLLPCLPVTSIPLCIFPSVTRCRRQFRRKMWPIQFAFRLRISCRIFEHIRAQNGRLKNYNKLL